MSICLNEFAKHIIPYQYMPGDACEFDWRTVKLDIGDNGYQKYQMEVFTSAYGKRL